MEKENNGATPSQADEKKEFKGRHLDEAISLAEDRLKLTREEFYYEIVAEKTRLFGIKAKEIVIRAWPKKESEEDTVENFLRRLKTVFPLDLSYQVKKRNGLVYVIFEGPDKALLLREEGTLLLAIQHVLNKISQVKVQVDCEFFRKRKENRLREFAHSVARQVAETGRDEILDFMNPYERRIVHIAVNQIPGVTTESLGEGFLKKMKVFSEHKRSAQDFRRAK